MKHFFSYVLAFMSMFGMLDVFKRLKDQRGEAVPEEEDGETGDSDLEKETEEIEEEDFELDFGDEDQKEAPEEEEEVPLDDKYKELEDKFKALETDVKAKSNKIADLNKALHSERQAKKVKKEDTEETETFTDTQLMGILKEHQGEPDILFNVMKQMVKQSGKDVEKKAGDAAKIAQQQQLFDSKLSQAYPDLNTEGSELRSNVDTVKDTLGISDHPFGDLFAMGTLIMNNLSNFQKDAYEQGKKEALGEKAEETRKKTVKKNAFTPTGKGSGKSDKISLTKEQLETAKGLGLTSEKQQKLYASMLRGDKK